MIPGSLQFLHQERRFRSELDRSYDILPSPLIRCHFASLNVDFAAKQVVVIVIGALAREIDEKIPIDDVAVG